ncbi:hypothetical protein Taro_003194 [Colocasia esculenta]|uniref:G patch domain-containing protein n=1 Tax=Colocasia esculenta TaxID=4460 RepID=A0A843TKZ3_COLES|nr:hypothetical protein [Colocasia esculenta]
MDDGEEDYVFFGTPIEREEETSRRKRKAVAEAGQLRSLPAWKQEVRDEEGRKRFHGAFTGGFSAGYYNTVGSKEGWTPQTFTSSRKNRAEVKQQSIYNFLDDDEKAPLLCSFLRDGEEPAKGWREASPRRPAAKAPYISPAAKPVLPEKTTVLVDTWDQDLFVKSGLHLICDDIFEISPSLTATSEPPDVTKDQCNYDMIWSDLQAHTLCRLQLFRRFIGLDIPMATLLVHDFIILLPLVWILRHFKTRGRVFSNQGRMMGSEKPKRWFKPTAALFLPPRRRRTREGLARSLAAKACREGSGETPATASSSSAVTPRCPASGGEEGIDPSCHLLNSSN